MRMVDIIQKKRDGVELTKAEIDFMIAGYTRGEIPDYQMSAFAMAVYFQGMTDKELSHLTMAMVHSGEQIDLSGIKAKKVDKHSTGGVGDKLSLIIAPLVAAAGVPVAKMSGRGLGHTGGTIDKLESIQGFQVELSHQEFIKQVNEYKIALVGQSGNLTPADKMLYSLRDVTATVDSLPLIASSIMSKKIAAGADAIVLDVKTGSGAFMKTLEEAKELAQKMVNIGKQLHKKTVALITDMNQPLGYEIGNANEVKEAIAVLSGKKIADLRDVSLAIAAQMTMLGDIYEDEAQAYEKLTELLENGKALAMMKQFVQAQGGDPRVIDDPSLLPQAPYTINVIAETNGYISQVEAETIGVAAMLLGAGRRAKDDAIDHAVGITLQKKRGDYAQKGEILAKIHSNTEQAPESEKLIKQAYHFSAEPPEKTPLIYEIIQ